MKISLTAKDVAEKTQDAYSVDRYTSWAAVAQLLLDRGYDDKQVEAILRSKWTRWAADASDKPYGKATSTHVAAWLDKTFLTRAAERKDVEMLTRESF